MCQQQQQVAANNNNNNSSKMRTSYSIKQVLKILFKRQHKQRPQRRQQQQHVRSHSLAALEAADNLRNAQMEQVCYAEIDENAANEKLAILAQEQQEEEADIYVPVRFARTEAGTFFWTTNLQPVSSILMPLAAHMHADLLQPAYCYTNRQYSCMQFQDRWAQA